ncbi:Abi family protein [Virgibacillus natechei]
MEKDVHIKSPTTFSEQIELLRLGNLEIGFCICGINVEEPINYYRPSAYMLTLKKDNEFIEGTTFNQLLAIYEVDRKLRHLRFMLRKGY